MDRRDEPQFHVSRRPSKVFGHLGSCLTCDDCDPAAWCSLAATKPECHDMTPPKRRDTKQHHESQLLARFGRSGHSSIFLSSCYACVLVDVATVTVDIVHTASVLSKSVSMLLRIRYFSASDFLECYNFGTCLPYRKGFLQRSQTLRARFAASFLMVGCNCRCVVPRACLR